MLTTLIDALKAEGNEGTAHAEQLIARIDSHIRDLEQLKAWIRDSAKVRSDAIEDLIGKG